jgi:hypothetical protein
MNESALAWDLVARDIELMENSVPCKKKLTPDISKNL